MSHPLFILEITPMPAFGPSWRVLLKPWEKVVSDRIFTRVAYSGGSFRHALDVVKRFGKRYGVDLTYARGLEQRTFSMFQSNARKVGSLIGKPLDYVPTAADIMQGRYWQPEPFKSVVNVTMVNTDTQETIQHHVTYYSEKPRSLGDIPVGEILIDSPTDWGDEWTVASAQMETVEGRSDL